MARSRTPKFDASEVITNEIIRIIERGVLPWRKPWTAGGSSRPLRVGGEPYQGVNNFLLTMRTVMAGHSSPFWMTLPQANALGAKVRKGEKSSVVVYYGQSRKDAGADENDRSDPSAIAAQNDAFRKLVCLGVPPEQPIQGGMHVTRSLMEAGDGFMAEAVRATGTFDTFEPENDPEGWHDFGAVEIRGETVFWKIDLYEADSDFRYGAEAPDNPATTMRVLTIMMARDW